MSSSTATSLKPTKQMPRSHLPPRSPTSKAPLKPAELVPGSQRLTPFEAKMPSSTPKPVEALPPSHPRPPTAAATETVAPPKLAKPDPEPLPPSPQKAHTHVIQVPKDLILRHPWPENSKRYNKKPRRCSCQRCLCCTVIILAITIAATTGVLFLTFGRPKAPKQTVDNISIKRFNLTSTGPINPEFDVTIGAENGNKKIGMYYEEGSSVGIYITRGSTSVMEPCQSFTSRRITGKKLKTVLKGLNVTLSKNIQTALLADQRKGKVPMRVDLSSSSKIKIGPVKIWTFPVKFKSYVMVNSLTVDSKIVSKGS